MLFSAPHDECGFGAQGRNSGLPGRGGAGVRPTCPDTLAWPFKLGLHPRTAPHAPRAWRLLTDAQKANRQEARSAAQALDRLARPRRVPDPGAEAGCADRSGDHAVARLRWHGRPRAGIRACSPCRHRTPRVVLKWRGFKRYMAYAIRAAKDLEMLGRGAPAWERRPCVRPGCIQHMKPLDPDGSSPRCPSPRCPRLRSPQLVLKRSV